MPELLTSRLSFTDLFLIFVVALLGLYGGTPFEHPDFLTSFVGATFKNGGNPKYFHYGSFIIYALAFVYGLTFVLLRISGIVHSTGEFTKLMESGELVSRPMHIGAFVPGHIFTVICSFAALCAVFWLTLRLTGHRLYAYSAVVLLGSSYQWFANSHFLTVDIPMTSLLILTIAFAVGLEGKLKTSNYFLVLGACAGVVAGAKYPGGLVIAPLIALSAVAFPPRELIRNVVRLAVGAMAAFIFTNPFAVLDFKTFWADFSIEFAHARYGHPGFVSPSFLFHTKVSLMQSFGFLGLVLSGLGLMFVVLSKEISKGQKVLLTVYPVLQFIMISSSALAFERYALPLLPFLAIFAAFALYRLSQIVGNSAAYAMIVAMVLIVIVPNTAAAIRFGDLLRGKDSRQVLLSLIGGEQFGRVYASNYLRMYLKNRVGSATPDGEVEALFLDSFAHDRDIYDDCRVDPVLPKLLPAFDKVLIINPFKNSKDSTPFSPQSVYSPAPPDMDVRNIAGPYIEIYFSSHNAHMAELVSRTADPAVSVLSATQGYYFQKLLPRCIDVEKRELMEVEKSGYKPLYSGMLPQS